MMAFNNYNDNLTYHNEPDYNNKKFENIKSIEELTHSFISQPNPNEFSIVLNDCGITCCGLVISAVFGAPAVGLIIYIIFASHYNAKAVYTGIVISALFCFFCLIFTFLDLIQSIKRIKITLDADGMKIIKIHLCPCRRICIIFILNYLRTHNNLSPIYLNLYWLICLLCAKNKNSINFLTFCHTNSRQE